MSTKRSQNQGKNSSEILIQIILEGGKGYPNKSSFSRDIPGCYSTGRTWRACKKHMKQALEFHIEMSKDDTEWPYADLSDNEGVDWSKCRVMNVKLSRKAQRACEHLRYQRGPYFIQNVKSERVG